VETSRRPTPGVDDADTCRGVIARGDDRPGRKHDLKRGETSCKATAEEPTEVFDQMVNQAGYFR
jgi:hypothetical protein